MNIIFKIKLIELVICFVHKFQSSVPCKSRVVKASLDTLFLICQLHIIAELVHHFHKGLVHDLLPALGDVVHLCVRRHTVSTGF